MHFAFCIIIFADVAELADALVSGSSEAIHVGSSPVVRTRVKTEFILGLYFFLCGQLFTPSGDGTDLIHSLRSSL